MSPNGITNPVVAQIGLMLYGLKQVMTAAAVLNVHHIEPDFSLKIDTHKNTPFTEFHKEQSTTVIMV